MFLPFGASIPSTTGLGPWHSLSYFSLSLCTPTDTSEEVADNRVATEAPAGEGEETVDAERVEQPVPQSVEAVTEPAASSADASRLRNFLRPSRLLRRQPPTQIEPKDICWR